MRKVSKHLKAYQIAKKVIGATFGTIAPTVRPTARDKQARRCSVKREVQNEFKAY